MLEAELETYFLAGALFTRAPRRSGFSRGQTEPHCDGEGERVDSALSCYTATLWNISVLVLWYVYALTASSPTSNKPHGSSNQQEAAQIFCYPKEGNMYKPMLWKTEAPTFPQYKEEESPSQLRDAGIFTLFMRV